MRVRLFEYGHSFEYIDKMRVTDLGDIVGYWSGKSRAEEKLRKQNERKAAAKRRRRGRK